ncbi:MAG: hypothetical protein Q9186_000757 [Xanthomendoza sp. 1 TL-2023]
MKRVNWWNTTVGVTLDTVSVIVTQYNNTAVTGRKTIFGHLNSSAPATAEEILPVQTLVGEKLGPIGHYDMFIYLNNGTDGQLDESVSIAYPTPYVGIPGYQYFSQTAAVPGCPAGQVRMSGGSCDCPMTLDHLWEMHEILRDADVMTIGNFEIKQTYYQALTLDQNDIWNSMEFESVHMETDPFSRWVASISPTPPGFESCFFVASFFGPPALKVPVSALTATVTTTVRGTDRYSWTSATPALSPPTKIPVETSMAPPDKVYPPNATPQSIQTLSASEITRASGAGEGPRTRTLASPPPEIVSGRSTYTLGPSSEYLVVSKGVSRDRQSIKSGNQISVAVGEVIATVQTSSQPSPEQDLMTSSVFSFLGSTYTFGMSSIVTINGQTVAPGDAVTIAGSIFSVPTISATSTLPSPEEVVITRPIMSLFGSVYTMDISSNFVLEGQTLQRGSAITVSGNVVSIPSGGSLLVFGGTTETLSQVTITAAAAVTSDGSIATSGSATGFVIDGTMLVPTSVFTGPKTLASGSNEGIDATSVGKAAPGSPSGEVANRTSTVGGTTGTSAKPVDIDGLVEQHTIKGALDGANRVLGKTVYHFEQRRKPKATSRRDGTVHDL